MDLFLLAVEPAQKEHAQEAMHEFLMWLNQYPMLSVLVSLMALDIVSGSCAAFVRKKLSSTISWRGITRKVMTLIIVGLAAIIDPYVEDLPLVKFVCLFYCAQEALSILENAAASGVPLPAVLVESLEKIKVGSKTPDGTTLNIDHVNAKVVVKHEEPSSASSSGVRQRDSPG